jgi:hypothetical protein
LTDTTLVERTTFILKELEQAMSQQQEALKRLKGKLSMDKSPPIANVNIEEGK